MERKNPFRVCSLLLTLSFAFVVVFVGCKKDSPPVKPQSQGTFTASIDNKSWQPIWYSAAYISQKKLLYVSATDNSTEFAVGINIDTISPLKEYRLEPNGSNAGRLLKSGDRFISDQNISDAGGSFTLTKFDTVNGKLSGKVNLVGYTANGSKRVIFDGSNIEDIDLTKNDSANIDGSFVSVTVQGEKTVNWYSNNLIPFISCITNGVHKTMEFHVVSVLGGIAQSRALIMNIPLDLGVGNFQVKPNAPPYYCGGLNLTVRYCMADEDINYYPVSGNFNITKMDTVVRTMTANFDFSVRDSVSHKTVHFTNGQVHLNRWYDF